MTFPDVTFSTASTGTAKSPAFSTYTTITRPSRATPRTAPNSSSASDTKA